MHIVPDEEVIGQEHNTVDEKLLNNEEIAPEIDEDILEEFEQTSTTHPAPHLWNYAPYKITASIYPTVPVAEHNPAREQFLNAPVHYPNVKILYQHENEVAMENSASTTSPCSSGNYNDPEIVFEDDLPYIIVDSNGQKTSFDEDSLPSFLLHRLRSDDTLPALSIAYGVLEEDIKLANMIMSELAYYNKPELLIPYPTILPKKRIALVEKDLEQKKRQYALQLFQTAKQVSLEEATYYLSLHDWDFKEAVLEYNEDVQWEKEQKEYKSRKRDRKKRKKISSTARRVLDLFGTCFPFLHSCLDPYGHAELDRLPNSPIELKELESPVE